MPRPTPAQITYGSATVVLSALAMLLVSQARGGIGIAVIALASLALGLVVALALALPRTTGRGVRGTAAGAPGRRAPLPAETRMSEHSLHG
ncbi:hypothetical protein [Streptomyces sp. ISL-11]|uniref:hypothetical protein n=1 Tax=Streptomyces sp. ISL-11 TaxID=2819174 RepID=UPI001BE952D0|nr:hypothetical protein [Streptomyces sp. ISL-11]MBT2382613.1 hypothetical protein [Streptomyces sp. ISL-11]